MPIPNFFFDFFGFSLKPLGKHWKWSDSSRNAKKKNHFCIGVVPCTVQHCIVQDCSKLYSTPTKFDLKFFLWDFWMN